jgi:LysR family transcriptional regulator for metE and metH
MDLEVRHLRLVRAVAAQGGLTRAGRELHLTQSALSHQLRDVETRLGTPIFLRVGKRMVLTSAGERLLRSADEILGTLERTEDAIRGLAAGGGGRLRVSAGGYTQYHWLPLALRRFRSVCPGVDVQIVAAAGDVAAGLLVDGSIDLCIAGHTIEDPRLAVRPLFDDELVAIVEPAHRLASKAVVGLQDLENETVLLEAPIERHVVYQRVLAASGVKLGRVQLVAQTGAMLELAIAGLGVGLVAKWAIEPWAREGALRALRLSAPGAAIRWNAIVIKELNDVPYVSAFVTAVRESFRQLAGGDRQSSRGWTGF